VGIGDASVSQSAYHRVVMKRFAPLLFVISCAPAKTERHVAAPAQPAKSAEVQTEVAAAKRTRDPVVHRLAANGWQTCLARVDGSVICWGQGALVDLDTPAPNRATTIAGLSDAVEVAVEPHWACARRKNGTVACFGRGLERAKATEVPGLTTSRIFNAREGICAVVGDELACFGPNLEMKRKKLPVHGADVIDATGSLDLSCIATSKGAVYCWGVSNLEALGGGKMDKDGFARVAEIDDAVAVSAGDYAACALLGTGQRACWGYRTPLGYPEKGRVTVVDTKRSDTLRAAAGRTTCWVFKGGSVKCDGEGKYGQHGDGSVSSYADAPVQGMKDAIDVAVGLDHVCALRANDEVACWGANERAQLGDGTKVDRKLPTGVLGLGGVEPPAPPKPGNGPPLAPPIKYAATPSWREADKPGWGRRIDSQWRRSGEHPIAVGVRAALFEDGRAVHDDYGVVTLAYPKGHTHRMLDGDDAVWVGTKDSFLRANDVLAAKKGAFTKVLAIPYATDFAVTKGLAVAADSTTLHISHDGGKTFTKLKPSGDLTIENVFARADGLIAVEGLDKAGEHAVWIAKDGKTFVASKLQPPSVGQTGSYLFAYGCPGGVLSSDGVTWNAWEGEYSAPLSFDAWGMPLVPSSWPRPFSAAKLANLIDPPAPAPSKDTVTGKPGACNKGGLGGVAMGLGRRGYRRGGACVGAACVRASLGDDPKSTETEVGLYGDGLCERDEKGLCVKGPWKRAPHAAINSGAPIDLPAGCDPTRMLTAGGIGVLVCAGVGKTALYTIAKDGVFREEATLPMSIEPDDVTIAPDGTLLVHPVCGAKGQGVTGPCPKALVRAPRPLGAKDAWREVSRGLAYRVLGNGAVLIVASGKDPQRFSLFVEGPGNIETTIATELFVAGDLLDVRVEKDRIVIVEQITTRKETTSYVANDGLVPIVEPKKP